MFGNKLIRKQQRVQRTPLILIGALLAGMLLFVSEVVLWVYWAAQGLVFLGIFALILVLIALGFAIHEIVAKRNFWAVPAIAICVLVPVLVLSLHARQIPHRYEFELRQQEREETAAVFIRQSTEGGSSREILPVINFLGYFRFSHFANQGKVGLVDVIQAPAEDYQVVFLREGGILENLLHGRIPVFRPLIHRIYYTPEGTPPPATGDNLVLMEFEPRWHWHIDTYSGNNYYAE
ncbi:MAG: hypothetical protein FH749_01515 [Firmicutes bacterium]|nr:hypothetical protein [Bacillota bacterium]